MKNKIEVVSDKVPEFLYPFYLAKIFKEHTGNNLNLIFPRTLSEKIQWLKLYDAIPEKTMWSDKLKARELFAEKIEGGEKYLKPLIKVWKNFDEINFEELPDSFILKSNNGSGFNSFIMNKSLLLKNTNQLKKLKMRTEYFQSVRYHLKSLELQYRNIESLIFAEELIGETYAEPIADWEIYCFNGEPKFITTLPKYKLGKNGCYRNEKSYVYNENYEKLDFSISVDTDDDEIEKPIYFEKMFEYARILSKDFKFVRVDFVENNGKLYFGELTFTPCSGFFRFNGLKGNNPQAKKIDLRLGKLLKIR